MKMKKILYISFIGSLSLFGAAYQETSASSTSHTTRSTASGNYYSDANLTAIAKSDTQKHAPLVLLIDETETPDNEYTNAVTYNFARLLQSTHIPIIVSRSIVFNYFTRRQQNKPLFNSRANSVDFKKWHLYVIPQTQFLLFIPEHYLKHYKDNSNFKLKELHNISSSLPSDNTYDTILSKLAELQNQYKSPEFSVDVIKKALINTKDPIKNKNMHIWDIVIHGHGKLYTLIGGLPPKDMQELLLFFNTNLKTGIVYIETCSAGGNNLSLLEFEQKISTSKNDQTVPINLNYIVIVGSISNKVTFVHHIGQGSQRYSQFFSNAARLKGKGASLETLLNDLNPMHRFKKSLHGSNSIPQVWLPQGMGFQTYQINKKVFSLGNVTARVHEDEQKPIIVPSTTRAILIYPKSISVPIKVGISSSYQEKLSNLTDQQRKIQYKDKAQYELHMRAYSWSTIPSVMELFTSASAITLKKISNKPKAYPALAHFFESNKYLNIIKLRSKAQQGIPSLYPEFISMIRWERSKSNSATHMFATHYFTKIELQEPQNKVIKDLVGVVHFTRDAFFDIDHSNTKKIFIIDELTGNNDLSALLELIRFKSNDPHPSQLEHMLRNHIGTNITLEKVRIIVSGQEARLTFAFNNTLWEFSFTPTEKREGEVPNNIVWNFKQPDNNSLSGWNFDYKWDYKRPLIHDKNIQQMPISEAIRKKIIAIERAKK